VLTTSLCCCAERIYRARHPLDLVRANAGRERSRGEDWGADMQTNVCATRDYELLAGNIPQKTTGKLHVIVES
jgi:hypothetical protein